MSKRKTNREVRSGLAKAALPYVRKLVKRFDLAAVNKAVFMLYEEQRAAAKLRSAEQEVEKLKRQLGK